jgi:hypothetical protein
MNRLVLHAPPVSHLPTLVAAADGNTRPTPRASFATPRATGPMKPGRRVENSAFDVGRVAEV